jgi:hypothetical protein
MAWCGGLRADHGQKHDPGDEISFRGGLTNEGPLQKYYCITNFVATFFLTIEAAQHGHRDMVLTSATIIRRRMVATELGM